MDVDFWASRVNSTKNLSVFQASRLNHKSTDHHMNIEGSEGDDEARTYFPCPFCYIEIELRVLCSHLQEEHCFSLKNAVCPLCAANLGKDVIGHFSMQHSHSVKRRRKPQKGSFWSNSSSMFGRDFRELSSYFGSTKTSGRGNAHDSAPDPLLSPFLNTVPLSDHKEEDKEDEVPNNAASDGLNAASAVPDKADEFQEQHYEERRQRAEFFQELVLSTFL